jgi:hypothetical protein
MPAGLHTRSRRRTVAPSQTTNQTCGRPNTDPHVNALSYCTSLPFGNTLPVD